jgi:hypothetical protein
MRRRLVIAVIGVGVATMLLVPGAAPQVPAQDSVTGSGSVNVHPVGVFTFSIDARSGPSGENPTGGMGFTAPIIVSGPVTCLAVSGNLAIFNVSFPVLGLLSFRAIDNSGSGTPDVLEFLPSRTPTDCSPPSSPGRALPLTSGDIVVVDAHPFPTSKDQCKNGGWRNFPGFKSQGDCVSFLATRGNRPPAGS